MAGGLTPEEITILLPLLDLKREQMVGDALPPLSSARLDEIAATLRAAPASELQFRALEIVATQYFLRKQPKKLLPVTQTLLQTAQALAAAERAKLDKESGFFNPYRPQPPRVLTAIFWLQRAGDEATAANFARDFARHVPARERPYAAMTLFQLGFPQLADSIFDPVREIPRIAAQRRADWKRNRVDWSLFTSWDEFAAAEARFRAPDAPFRWFDKVAKENRAQVLRTWVMALYPEPGLKSPFVRVTPAGSSASF